MRINTVFRIMVIATGFVWPTFATALSMVLPFGDNTYTVDVLSLKESRFQTILQQQYDYSCGSATVASLLTFHYDDPKTEEDVFQAMWRSGDQEKIRQQGFSLLDMKRYLERGGYQAGGFKIPLDRLARIGIPAITLINTKGYMHFVVVKGISDTEILVGDPALGVRVVPEKNSNPCGRRASSF